MKKLIVALLAAASLSAGESTMEKIARIKAKREAEREVVRAELAERLDRIAAEQEEARRKYWIENGKPENIGKRLEDKTRAERAKVQAARQLQLEAYWANKQREQETMWYILSGEASLSQQDREAEAFGEALGNLMIQQALMQEMLRRVPTPDLKRIAEEQSQ